MGLTPLIHPHGATFFDLRAVLNGASKTENKLGGSRPPYKKIIYINCLKAIEYSMKNIFLMEYSIAFKQFKAIQFLLKI